MTSASCHVLCDRALSNSFKVERGVKQDSVLSPTFFLLVMDPLLKQLEVSGLGLSVNNFYAGEGETFLPHVPWKRTFRKAFFHFGSIGAIQGDLSPLSPR